MWALKMTKNEARQSEDAIGFFPMYSHGIKSLTNAVLTVSKALSEALNKPGLRDEQYLRECVQLMLSASSSVMPLVDNLLDVGKQKLISSKINPHAVYNLRQEFDCALATFSYEALAKKIKLSLFFEENMPVVYWDIVSLRVYAINNILSNALHNSPIGGRILISVKSSGGNQVEIKISSSGPSIALAVSGGVLRKNTEMYGDIFNEKCGTGLHDSKLCVEAHAGKISIVDEPEYAGATFKIELPLHTQFMQ